MVTEHHRHHVMHLANNFANKKDISVGLLPVTRKSGPINRRKFLCCKDVVKLDFRKKHHYETVLVKLQFKTENQRMKIRDKILIQKYFLNVFNGIFLALGLMLLIFGLWLFFDRNNLFSVLFSSGENQLVAYISCMLLGIGSVITFTSAVGFLGSVKEIKRLLVTYMSFQILVFVTQMAILVLIFVKKEESSLTAFMISPVINGDLIMSMVGLDYVLVCLSSVSLNCCGSRDFSKATYLPPTLMECCGRYNVTQWERNKNKENSTQIPCSCIKSSLKKWFCDVPRDSTYSMGCEEYLNTWFENNILILTAVTISLLITQIFLITLTCQLFRNIRKNNIWPKES